MHRGRRRLWQAYKPTGPPSKPDPSPARGAAPQEVKLGDGQRTRALFERATRLALPPKKMKGLFKRWLGYESEAGNTAGVEHVKRRAMEFVEGSMRG